MEEHAKHSSASPILLTKVFFSGIQVTQLAQNFDLKWPTFLEELFEQQSTVSGNNLLVIDCIFPRDYPVLYQKAAAILLCLPLSIFLLVLFWGGVYLNQKRKLPPLGKREKRHPADPENEKMAEHVKEREKEGLEPLHPETEQRLTVAEVGKLDRLLPYNTLIYLGVYKMPEPMPPPSVLTMCEYAAPLRLMNPSQHWFDAEDKEGEDHECAERSSFSSSLVLLQSTEHSAEQPEVAHPHATRRSPSLWSRLSEVKNTEIAIM